MPNFSPPFHARPGMESAAPMAPALADRRKGKEVHYDANVPVSPDVADKRQRLAFPVRAVQAHHAREQQENMSHSGDGTERRVHR